MYNCDDNYHDHGQDHIQNHDEDCCGKTCPELVRGCKVNASSTSLGHPAHHCNDAAVMTVICSIRSLMLFIKIIIIIFINIVIMITW